MRQRISFCTTTDGVRIAYATAGRGAPLLRVGGWLTHVEHDWNSPVWRPWLRELTREHTLARFDIRGSGLSDRAVTEQGLEAWVRDLEAVVDSLGWKRFPMLGICQGGAIALAYAARHPERISRLVLYNAYTQGAFTPGASRHKTEEAKALASMITVGWGHPTGAFREVFARLFSPQAPEEQVAWWEELQRITAEPDSAARLWRGFHEIDIHDGLLARVAAPTLVAHVKGDAVVPFEVGRRLAAAIAGARFLPLEGANHVLQPGDRGWRPFIEELRRFLVHESKAGAAAPAGFEALTRRESAVLEAVSQGLSNAEIAETLALAPKTVRNHVSNICGKLDASSRAQLIVRAREAGFGTERA